MTKEILKHEVREYEDEIDLVDLLKILKKRAKLIMGIFLITTLIAFGIGISKYNSGKRVSTIVSYNFNEISEGLNPDGSKFNPNLIISNEVLNGVIKHLGLEGKELNVVEIREKISVNPIVPTYIYTKIKSELEKGINSSFNATAYEIELKIIKDSDLTKKILQTLVVEYSNYYSARYAQSDVVPVIKMDETYEYQDYIKVFKSKLKDIEYILKSKNDQSFVSKQNGVGFSSISNKIELIREVDITRVQQYLVIDGISKNKEMASKDLEYRIKNYESEKQKKVNEVEALNGVLKLYKPEGNKVLMSGNAGTMLEQNPNEYYSKLIEKVAVAAVEIGNIDEEIKTLKEGKVKINSSNGENKKILEATLAELEKDVNDVAISANEVLKEYNDRFVTNYVKTISPVNEMTNSKKAVMIIAIGMILGLFLGVFVAFMKEFFANVDLKN